MSQSDDIPAFLVRGQNNKTATNFVHYVGVIYCEIPFNVVENSLLEKFCGHPPVNFSLFYPFLMSADVQQSSSGQVSIRVRDSERGPFIAFS